MRTERPLLAESELREHKPWSPTRNLGFRIRGSMAEAQAIQADSLQLQAGAHSLIPAEGSCLRVRAC